MLDFNKVSDAEFAELKLVIQKSVEKSELERNHYLFSIEKMSKSKVFLLCYRFLLNAHNLLLEGGLKTELKKEIDLLEDTYNKINQYNDFLESKKKYGKHLIVSRLFDEINRPEVNNLIDVFAILTERVNIISMSRFKGVVLEGKSGDEFNRIMKSDEN